MLGAWAASAAKRMAGQTDEQGWDSGVSCMASICCRPNALCLQEMPCSAAGILGKSGPERLSELVPGSG